jgi:hypothetical protein
VKEYRWGRLEYAIKRAIPSTNKFRKWYDLGLAFGAFVNMEIVDKNDPMPAFPGEILGHLKQLTPAECDAVPCLHSFESKVQQIRSASNILCTPSSTDPIDEVGKYKSMLKSFVLHVGGQIEEDLFDANTADISDGAPKAGSPKGAAVTAANIKPVWNRSESKLFLGDAIAKTIRRLGNAKNVALVLDVFEESGWPSRIDDPLPGGTHPQRLQETVKSLNNGLTGILFHADGTGRGIKWEMH